MIPRATYRVQFHKDFPFAEAAKYADYFASLGISHIYASPIFAARAGSMHGYDVIDHSRINPELGGEEGFRAMVAALKAQGLGVILDIVPNHMAVGQADNLYWLDLLEKGRASEYATMFDIDWDAPGLEGKILAPFLDGEPQALWENGDLTLLKDSQLGKWSFAYFEHRFPLSQDDQSRSEEPQTWIQASQLLAGQHFVLADWRDADSRINWRRFFDVTELAAIRPLEPATFEKIHGKLFALYAEGLIDGVRVDHIDGIADPLSYCRLLRDRLSALGPTPYLVVEKILAEGESLPADWPVHGTTGYEVMNDISALQHAEDFGALDTLWEQASGRTFAFEQEETKARHEILSVKFSAQLDSCTRAFARCLPDQPFEELRKQIFQTIVVLRRYRGYVTGRTDSPAIDAQLASALKSGPLLAPLFSNRSGDSDIIDALRRFHQLSAPVAAKAVEDTAFYRYGRLLSRNDVGFDPRRTFLSVQDFHTRVQTRMQWLPHSMLTTATHDHKRGEDSRARLAALTALPQPWRDLVRNAPRVEGLHDADVYFLMQTLVGAWPAVPFAEFAERIEAWCRKYLREGKLRSSWQNPDIAYEELFCAFARNLILHDAHATFRQRLEDLLGALAPIAEANTFVQAVLRCTLPGVPDLYQGTEYLDLSLVDPDNRRPVDFPARCLALTSQPRDALSLSHRKQWLVATLLRARSQLPDLWEHGTYEPVAAPAGSIAFTRRHMRQALTVFARSSGTLENEGILDLEPGGADLLTGRKWQSGPAPVGELLKNWPATVIFGEHSRLFGISPSCVEMFERSA